MNDNRWLLLLCSSRMGFALIGTSYSALIPLLRRDWNMTASQAGLVQSAWHGGYIVSLVAAGMLMSRFGAKRTFLGMGMAAGASALLFALGAHDFSSALLLYGLAGICAGGSYVPGLTLIAERFPAAGRGRAMGFYIAAASFGYAVSIAGSSALAAIDGPRAGFLLAAGGTVAGLLLAAYGLRATPNRIVGGGGASLRSMRWLWRNKPARYVILAYTFHAWELLGMWAWLPAFLTAALAVHGASAAAVLTSGAMLAALTHLVSVAGSMCGGIWSDRWGRTRVILLLSLASIACSLLFGWLLAAPLWIVIAVAVLFNFSAIGDSAIYSAALTEVVPARHLPTAYSVRSVSGYGMGALSPWLFGLMLDFGASRYAGHEWGVAWLALGLIALTGPLMTHRLQTLQRSQPTGAVLAAP